MMTRYNDDFDMIRFFDKVVGFDKYFPPFQSQIRDKSIYWYKNHDDHQTITISVPGFSEDMISVEQGYDEEADQAYICTSGEVEDEDGGTKFSCNYRFWVDEKKIARVSWGVDNGLLKIQLWYHAKKAIPVEKIK